MKKSRFLLLTIFFAIGLGAGVVFPRTTYPGMPLLFLFIMALYLLVKKKRK